MKIELYPPLSIHEIGQRENQEDSIIQWNNRLFVLIQNSISMQMTIPDRWALRLPCYILVVKA